MDLIDRIRLPFRKDRESYSRLYHILGFYPRNIYYYKKALIHKSANLDKDWKTRRLENNERLEFLGDAVLGAIVGDIVYHHFEKKREGFLTNARSKVVQRETLNRIAKEIGLDEMVHKAIAPNCAHNSHTGGNAFEALIGAIYLDRGYDYCMKFMEKRILKNFIDLNKVAYKEVNFKSKLIEWSQKNRVVAKFESEAKQEEKGVQVFYSRVLIEDVVVGNGKGYSKKESQQNAAKETLALLKKRPQIVEKIFAAKSKRTAMEEEPRAVVDVDIPLIEKPVGKSSSKPTKIKEEKPAEKQNKKAGKPTSSETQNSKDRTPKAETAETDRTKPSTTSKVPDVLKEEEMDLSHISLNRELSRDEIIAAAEEAAFNGKDTAQ